MAIVTGSNTLTFLCVSIFFVPVTSFWPLNSIHLSKPKVENLSSVWNYQPMSPNYIMLVDSISKGTELGLSECQYQFRWERWDCSDRNVLRLVHSSKVQANRETAVVQALVTSGVTYVVTHNCSTGALMSCSCDSHLSESQSGQKWRWGGCRSSSMESGVRVSRILFDSATEGTDARAAVSLHNFQAGREAILVTLKKHCKCHGVSGSCTLRTCWKRLPDFRQVGSFLKDRYVSAVHVTFQNGQLRPGKNTRHLERVLPENEVRRRGQPYTGNQPYLRHRFRLRLGHKAKYPRSRRQLPISAKDLAYLVTSPNYCLPKAGGSSAVRGTEGRECSRPPRSGKASAAEKRSCRKLCKECGFKVQKYMVEVVTKCNCRFYWCCSVTCKDCSHVVEKYYCQR